MAASSNNNMNMLAMVFASWQRADGRFPPDEPIYRMVRGPPGCSIVLHIAWRRNSPDGRFLHYEGFARVYRIFNTGQWDYQLYNFEARPCALCRRMHWDCDVGFRGGDDGDGRYGGGGRDICPFEVGGGGHGRDRGRGHSGGRGGGRGGGGEEQEDEDTADSASRNAGRAVDGPSGGGGDGQ